jgi:hypothetical protein
LEYAELLKSGVGGAVGFLLAQLVNVAKVCRDRWLEPKLVIEVKGQNSRLLSHTVEAPHGQYLKEEIYGFSVRNIGRSVATGIRVQLVRIEQRGRKDENFGTISEHAQDLEHYNGDSRASGGTEAVLVPGAAVIIELAWWPENWWALMPAVAALPHYFEESCADASVYRFTVVVFDDKARFAQQIITIDQRV